MSLPQELLSKYDVNLWDIKEVPSPTFVTPSSERHTSDYTYIAKLIENPITDGRHRILWQVLAPYAVNVLKLNRSDAMELVDGYIEMCNALKPTNAGFKSAYYVDRAMITGLLPPRLDTIKRNDEDLYDTIVAAIGSYS